MIYLKVIKVNRVLIQGSTILHACIIIYNKGTRSNDNIGYMYISYILYIYIICMYVHLCMYVRMYIMRI